MDPSSACLSPSDWTFYKDVMSLYIDSAKTFTGLSSAGLAVTLIFREKIVGDTPGSRVHHLMVWAWFFFLLTIVSGALYQYLAVKYLDMTSTCHDPVLMPYLVSNPGFVYGVMLWAFVFASLFLVLTGWKQLPRVK